MGKNFFDEIRWLLKEHLLGCIVTVVVVGIATISICDYYIGGQEMVTDYFTVEFVGNRIEKISDPMHYDTYEEAFKDATKKCNEERGAIIKTLSNSIKNSKSPFFVGLWKQKLKEWCYDRWFVVVTCEHKKRMKPEEVKGRLRNYITKWIKTEVVINHGDSTVVEIPNLKNGVQYEGSDEGEPCLMNWRTL